MTPNGSLIRRIRRAQKIGLRTLQQQTGLDRGYLSRLERGLIRKPADERVQRVARALDVPPDLITQKEKT